MASKSLMGVWGFKVGKDQRVRGLCNGLRELGLQCVGLVLG